SGSGKAPCAARGGPCSRALPPPLGNESRAARGRDATGRSWTACVQRSTRRFEASEAPITQPRRSGLGTHEALHIDEDSALAHLGEVGRAGLDVLLVTDREDQRVELRD